MRPTTRDEYVEKHRRRTEFMQRTGRIVEPAAPVVTERPVSIFSTEDWNRWVYGRRAAREQRAGLIGGIGAFASMAFGAMLRGTLKRKAKADPSTPGA